MDLGGIRRRLAATEERLDRIEAEAGALEEIDWDKTVFSISTARGMLKLTSGLDAFEVEGAGIEYGLFFDIKGALYIFQGFPEFRINTYIDPQTGSERETFDFFDPLERELGTEIGRWWEEHIEEVEEARSRALHYMALGNLDYANDLLDHFDDHVRNAQEQIGELMCAPRERHLYRKLIGDDVENRLDPFDLVDVVKGLGLV